MLNIVLLCQFGASTGMLSESIKKEANAQGMEAIVNAYGVTEIENVIDSADIILFGPQMRFRLDELSQQYADKNVPFMVIDTMDYGMMNGAKVLQDTLETIKNFERDK